MTTADIVCTTIGDGSFLKHYAAALAGAEDRARIIVIPDRKTPAALYEAVADTRAQGFTVECPDLSEQEQFLASLGAPAGMFPWDTDHRRNIGYLMAWRDGADIMISVDDDNLPLENWLTLHAEAFEGGKAELVMSSPTGFWNPCRLLAEGWLAPYWPRGYPYSARELSLADVQEYQLADVAINAGLWSGEPDVDAITRLALHPVSYWASGPGRVLAPDTWAPVNSQNTAIRRDVIPAYHFFRSGRFGDIYQGYLAQACAKAMGHAVRFGTPVADCTVRNDHDLLRDLQLELPDILILDRWLDWLTSLTFTSSDYGTGYEYLAGELAEYVAYNLHDNPLLHPLLGMSAQMHKWLSLIRKIGA